MGFLVAGLFFWRFWRKSADALFAAFAAAFVLFAVDQFFHAIEPSPANPYEWPFLFRIAGFGLLSLAVLRKNLK
jgi:hypothetical protein